MVSFVWIQIQIVVCFFLFCGFIYSYVYVMDFYSLEVNIIKLVEFHTYEGATYEQARSNSLS